jgi:RNA polymerase sigma-70 factor (family 1)
LEGAISHTRIADLQRRIAVYEDESAYKELFFLLFNSLVRFATGFVQSKETAEEIVSDIFITVWNERSKLEEIKDLRVYLFVAVKNNSLRKLKQEQKRTIVSLDELSVEMDSAYPNPEDQTLSAESVKRIESAINHLPNRARLIFKLAKEDKLKYKDIAELLQISVKTIDHQLAISLKKIAAALNFSSQKRK